MPLLVGETAAPHHLTVDNLSLRMKQSMVRPRSLLRKYIINMSLTLQRTAMITACCDTVVVHLREDRVCVVIVSSFR